MKIILNKKKLLKFIHNENSLGFVPTMGAIHLGHISLIKKSISQCRKTIVTIFINKPQFNKRDDYQKYPKILKKDINKLKSLKIDYLYLPSIKQIYPHGNSKKIKIHSFSKKLCGKFRPGHFEAVADVIDRFIKIIKPTKIYFGNKDMQQLKIIDDFIKKNHPQIKVVGCKIIREKNGLAYSSRNFLLSNRSKIIGSNIYKYLVYQKNNILENKNLLKKARNDIIDMGIDKIEYIKIIDLNKIIKPYKKKRHYKIFISYYINSIRLIDNI